MARNVHWPHESSNSNSTTTTSASTSDRSDETTATEYSQRPSLPQHGTCHGRVEGNGQKYFAYDEKNSARVSVDTYASTSEEELDDDYDEVPEYHVPQYHHEPLPIDAIPTTPRDFADLFPTSKRISIRHDDSTIDGNMNLRVDTQVEERHHRKQNYTLFHLRMHDLRTREFSLRRYCRDSGREVCHSIRKYHKPPPERPALQRASTALANLMHKPDSRPSTAAGLKRSDSGYESIRGGGAFDFEDDADDSRPKTTGYAKGRALMPTNTIKLEFSNYAHMDIKRRGAASNKRYGFEHWGYEYSWKRLVQREDGQETIHYYLVRSDNDKHALAHISPIQLTQDQLREERARSGWIPPCYMRITDEKILSSTTDISDVVIATGLIALVDDCIKRKFHSKQTTQIHIPLTRNSSFKMDYVGPKRLIDEVFHRTNRHGGLAKQPPTLRRTATES
ncbi:hypothetical protein BU24DRAFT_425601 [Aaosphaeria arxii CBS 175.79]|uniref:Uncharacterized protein n=1 Tax=Aaosphaeria arxii CBS 175.79 TaxID=1450172 RepID=A0A6A5XJI4_9PLEO|nr:uncharacterized protein BU24DRAFT_425601 [Aaosphaeria arxii CBS 175.79]KAF2013039.1 hypothetical protein BU24DRAFT_425601 [Aaosphaeria arxii CBS 175.79]